jgi:hypothetical protein
MSKECLAKTEDQILLEEKLQEEERKWHKSGELYP